MKLVWFKNSRGTYSPQLWYEPYLGDVFTKDKQQPVKQYEIPAPHRRIPFDTLIEMYPAPKEEE